MQQSKWDIRFLEMARLISGWSKDPTSKVGCVVVRDRRVLATGYNGFAKNMPDGEKFYADREYKMRKVIHAEQNAIYNATEAGISLKGSTFYVYGLHICEQCAQAIINVGASRVIIEEKELPQRWKDSCLSAAFDFTHVGITYDAYKI